MRSSSAPATAAASRCPASRAWAYAWRSSSKGGIGGPAIKFKVEGPHGGGSEEHLLVDQDFGDETYVGPIRVQLRRKPRRAQRIANQPSTSHNVQTPSL